MCCSKGNQSQLFTTKGVFQNESSEQKHSGFSYRCWHCDDAELASLWRHCNGPFPGAAGDEIVLY